MNEQTLLIFFDARCELCRAMRSALWGSDAPLAFVDINEPGITNRFPQLRGRPLGCQMHVIDAQGALTAGYDALVAIASRISSMQPFLPLMRWEPVRALGRPIYRFMAEHRYAIFGETPSSSVCELAK